MDDMLLIPGQHIHIIGIGGFGMSAIARVLLENGFVISGSDRQLNDLSVALQRDGALIYEGHAAEYIVGAEMVLASSAIPSDNPELRAARLANVPIMYRRDFIATLLEGSKTIGVAGTHGKTTTTALMAHVFKEAGVDPSYIVGGVMKNYGTNAGAGQGDYFIIEADEYDHMFLGLKPTIAVINNIEYDHPDFFHSPAEMLAAFQKYVALLDSDGLLVANGDNDVTRSLADARSAAYLPVQTYGVDNRTVDWWATDLQSNKGGVDFTVHYGAFMGGRVGRTHLPLPGHHNVENAMAVMTVARYLGIPFDVISGAFETFTGTGRRSDVMGEAAGIKIVSDYAHHPTAIYHTLQAWREQLTDGELWGVWQPHTYSRTRTLADTFKDSFGAAHHALVTEIYPSREKFTPGLVGKDLARMIAETGHPDARFAGDLMETAQILANEVQRGDVVIIMSAGDAPQIGAALLAVLQKRAAQ